MPRYWPVTRTLWPARPETLAPLTCGSFWVTLVTNGLAAAPSPPPSVVTHRSLSVVATQNVTLAHDTRPSSLVVSALTALQEPPPSAVPTSATEVPAPAPQQCDASGQLIEDIQPVLSRVSMPLQVAPPSDELMTTGPAPARASAAAVHVGRPVTVGRQERPNICCTP